MRFTDLVSVINPLFSPPKSRACFVRINHLFPHPPLSGFKINSVVVCTAFNNEIPILHNIPTIRIKLNDSFRPTIGGKSTHTSVSVCCKLITKSFNLVKNLAFLL